MYTSAGLSALLFAIHVSAGQPFASHNFATVTVPGRLWARQDAELTDLGPGCSKSTISISSSSPVVLPAICLATFPAYTPSSAGTNSAATAKDSGGTAKDSATAAKNSATTTGSSGGKATAASQKTTANSASVTCYQQNDDPDSGIEQQGCICNQGTTTKTLPLLATGVAYSSSCDYTELATKTIAITQNWGTPVTNTQICQACTPTTDFGSKCTSLPNCLPETPSATVQIGTSPVQVGTLTSEALYTSISSAIATLCPVTATQCDEKTQIKIGNIVYVEEESLVTDGELIVQVDSSGYNDSSTLKTLIGMAAKSISSSATGNNCANYTYTVEEGKKRDLLSPFEEIEERDTPHPVEEKILLCHAGHFASPQYYSQYWREAAKPGPQDYLSVEITFGTGPGGAIFCEFIKDLLEFMEIAFTPELLGEEQVADEEFGKIHF